MKIVALHASNIKRLRAVDITPQPGEPLVVVTGKNGAGKSSVLDSIMYALGGGRALPSKPVRDGEAKGEVVLELDDYVVKRRFTADGGGSLTVSPRGVDAALRGPQAILDALVGELSFDPLEFARMKAAERRTQLLKLAGLGKVLDLLDARRRAAEEKRRDHKRDVQKLEATISTLAAPADGETAEPVDVQALVRKIEVIREHNQHRADVESHISAKAEEIERHERAIATLQAKIQELKAERAELGQRLEAFPWTDTADLQAEIATSTQRNHRAAEIANFKRLQAQAAEENQRVAAAQADLDAIASEKATALAGAKLPIEGLGISDDEVTFNGIPFDQLASSEQLRVSLAMAMALNPKLRVIRCTEGSLLDRASLEIVRELAAKQDYQVWIERVDDASQGAIVIEDGAVVEVTGPAAA